MGYKLTKCNRGQAWERPTLSSIHDNYKLHGRLWVENDSYYKWDTSWDWLMPVVEKIESFKYVDGSVKYNVRMERCTVEIIDSVSSTVFIGVDAEWLGFGADSKDIAVYKAVVEFIKYYNKFVKEE